MSVTYHPKQLNHVTNDSGHVSALVSPDHVNLIQMAAIITHKTAEGNDVFGGLLPTKMGTLVLTKEKSLFRSKVFTQCEASAIHYSQLEELVVDFDEGFTGWGLDSIASTIRGLKRNVLLILDCTGIDDLVRPIVDKAISKLLLPNVSLLFLCYESQVVEPKDGLHFGAVFSVQKEPNGMLTVAERLYVVDRSRDLRFMPDFRPYVSPNHLETVDTLYS